MRLPTLMRPGATDLSDGASDHLTATVRYGGTIHTTCNVHRSDRSTPATRSRSRGLPKQGMVVREGRSPTNKYGLTREIKYPVTTIAIVVQRRTSPTEGENVFVGILAALERGGNLVPRGVPEIEWFNVRWPQAFSDLSKCHPLLRPSAFTKLKVESCHSKNVPRLEYCIQPLQKFWVMDDRRGAARGGIGISSANVWRGGGEWT